MAGRVADRLCTWLIGLDSISPEKNAEEGAWEEVKLCWGYIYKTDVGTAALPQVKILKAYYLFSDPSFDRGGVIIKLELLQQLRGNAEFWSVVQPGLVPELKVIDAMLAVPEGVQT